MALRRVSMALAVVAAVLLLQQGTHGAELSGSKRQQMHAACEPGATEFGCVVKRADGQFEFTKDSAADCVASGVYIDSAETASNFGKLRLVSFEGHADADQMYAVGYAEGYMTAARIFDNHYNMKSYFVDVLNATLDRPMDWFDEQWAWAQQQVAERSTDDEAGASWRLLGLLLRQFDGLVDGYQARARHAKVAGEEDAVGWLDRRELMFVNNNGDLYDLLDYFDVEGPRISPQRIDPDPNRMAQYLALQGKCSALIKVTGDLSDLLIGHSTWDTFTAMLRIYKHYDFALADPAVVSRRMSFSSYPGELFSDDDLYLMESGLVMVETTNHIYTPDVYKPLTPSSVLSWQRVRIANMMASDGESWVKQFSAHNSGTYNNQYMVVDMNKFKPGHELQPGLLWVVEQLPSLVQGADMTEVLARGYWPSYNVAYFPQIYDAAGYPDMIAKFEEQGAKKYAFSIRWLKYQVSPRAAIFRRDQGNVEGLEDMKRMMRYNEWQDDPYSYGNPIGAVCGRGDLDKSPDAIARGCYDSKVTNYALARNMEAEVVGGPTAQNQPVFVWGADKRWAGLAHRGHPKVFNFTFERMAAKDLPLPHECQRLEQEQRAGGAAQAAALLTAAHAAHASAGAHGATLARGARLPAERISAMRHRRAARRARNAQH